MRHWHVFMIRVYETFDMGSECELEFLDTFFLKKPVKYRKPVILIESTYFNESAHIPKAWRIDFESQIRLTGFNQNTGKYRKQVLVWNNCFRWFFHQDPPVKNFSKIQLLAGVWTWFVENFKFSIKSEYYKVQSIHYLTPYSIHLLISDCSQIKYLFLKNFVFHEEHLIFHGVKVSYWCLSLCSEVRFSLSQKVLGPFFMRKINS